MVLHRVDLQLARHDRDPLAADVQVEHPLGKAAAVHFAGQGGVVDADHDRRLGAAIDHRSEEHTSELQSLMRISYAVFCLKKKKKKIQNTHTIAHYTPKTPNK